MEPIKYPTIKTAQAGDFIALCSYNKDPQKVQVTRATPNRVSIGDIQYVRRTGDPVGRSVGDGVYTKRYTWVEQWDDAKHLGEIEERKEQELRSTLINEFRNTRWNELSSTKLRAVKAVLELEEVHDYNTL